MNMKKTLEMLTEASMNISINGSSTEEVADLLNVLKNAGVTAQVDMPKADAHVDGHDDMVSKMRMMNEPEEAPCGMGEDEEIEEWENSPDGSEDEPEYKDTHHMVKDLAGGMHKVKKAYSPAAGGDNPMAIEASIAKELAAALKEKLSK